MEFSPLEEFPFLKCKNSSFLTCCVRTSSEDIVITFPLWLQLIGMNEHHKHHHEAHQRNESSREQSSIDVWNEASGRKEANINSDKHKTKVHVRSSSSHCLALAL